MYVPYLACIPAGIIEFLDTRQACMECICVGLLEIRVRISIWTPCSNGLKLNLFCKDNNEKLGSKKK